MIFHGERFDDAKSYCEALAKEHGYRYIHSGDEPHLIAGVATASLEMLQDEPELDMTFVPIGGGSGAGRRLQAEKRVGREEGRDHLLRREPLVDQSTAGTDLSRVAHAGLEGPRGSLGLGSSNSNLPARIEAARLGAVAAGRHVTPCRRLGA